MQVLFVHGLGRSPLCGSALLRRLRAEGWRTSNFGYLAALERLDGIVDRLASNLRRLARRGDYVLIGHSLGGVLLRMALNRLPSDVRQPCQLVLLASPVRDSRLARWSRSQRLYRMFSSDSGALLASAAKMKAIGTPTVPTLSIIGTRGDSRTRQAFAGQVNDGVLSRAEVMPWWSCDVVEVEDGHLGLPSNAQVVELVAEHLLAVCEPS
jgi:pimeloyl-ACP methyl ester carboxylesterase